MKTKDFLLSCCAPALLVSVAALQFHLSKTQSLSPWKGGGFGMFSTVDAPGARFIRVYLLSGAEKIPVLLPDKLRTIAYETRVHPTAEKMAVLAKGVAGGIWVPYRLTSAVNHYEALLEGTSDLLPGSREPEVSPSGPGNPAEPQQLLASGHPDGHLNLDGLGMFRMLEEEEPSSPPSERLGFSSVRVEVWVYRFDAESLRLKAAKLMDVTARAGP